LPAKLAGDATGPQAWAIVGVAALVQRSNGQVANARIGLTNMGPVPVRAGDLHGAPDYRRHQARVLTGRALAAAAGV
jgi:carbon-monoxide dehydrogenase medium subunit